MISYIKGTLALSFKVCQSSKLVMIERGDPLFVSIAPKTAHFALLIVSARVSNSNKFSFCSKIIVSLFGIVTLKLFLTEYPDKNRLFASPLPQIQRCVKSKSISNLMLLHTGRGAPRKMVPNQYDSYNIFYQSFSYFGNAFKGSSVTLSHQQSTHHHHHLCQNQASSSTKNEVEPL